MSDAEAVRPATSSEDKPKREAGSSRATFPIVGIGASAGGLEACQTLLKALPANLGMAYVFVPHLDPVRESAFREILARATSMPVLEADNGTRVAPNQVYVIPRNCEMTIGHGVLHLAEREEPRSMHMTIDIFLRSLAADQGNNAIGVILSGTASDGTIGMSAIKGEGGITFAQDSSAKYDGMPASAIAAGCVDLILPPNGIARELTRIARHPHVLGEGIELTEVGETREAQMSQLFTILRRVGRVDFSEYKPPTIGRRVSRRMALHKIERLADYVTLLQKNRDEVTALYQDLLINVTSFFRDPEAFEALKKAVYPELLKQRESAVSVIRIWVPGCSTGEETYSHAISLMEFLGEERTEVPIQIFGTDLSEPAIQRARTGLYKESIAADVSPIRLRRFFHHVDSGYQISKTIRDLCIFSTQNVFSDPPFSRIDLVSCRNVMIYLSQSLQKRIIPVFHYALNPGGFLMVGNTEGLLGAAADLFEMADKKQKIYRKKSVPTPVTFGFTVHPAEAGAEGPAHAVAAKPAEPPRPPMDLQREADRLLLARYAPPSVVVNESLEIVQTKGHTGPFLELPAGKISTNLLKMARPGLLFELQNALDEARKSGVDAVRTNVTAEGHDGSTLTTLRVTPFRTPAQDRSSFLVAFEPPDGKAISTAAEVVVAPLSEDERTLKDKQLAQVRQELAATKEYLQSIIEALESTNEELQSANEEIQSGNEELQSTNEELQTSKEELESANEELHTVNEEMQHRNDQLTQLNNDLNNLLNSVNLPMVMVGPDLSVRRFTPQAGKVLGLAATDVGRPITRLRLRIEASNLEQMMLDVIAEVRPAQYRVRDGNGQWCDLRLTPYRTADNRIDGVVLSVLSFDEMQEARALPKAGAQKTQSGDGSRKKALSESRAKAGSRSAGRTGKNPRRRK
ncbi:MAG TPA: chemotaxis protein CheB [Candidatus Binatia bacterium]|nr:chemotaxis protein CheB [Candidatus Binatia bacterium]